jgi:pimeloyl-ACP methyl ester carboxylesterase
LRYDRPGQVVEVAGGRTLNLRCAGRGTPTVILEAGFGATSQAWVKVQPQVARLTRVCAYDRAGYGFSPPGPLPRDGAAIVRDLDQALQAGGIKGPYIVVGHSAGGLYARLFAARHVREVQGLVFLDATPERLGPPPPTGADHGLEGIRRRLKHCLALASTASAGAPEHNSCAAADDRQAQAMAADPATWRNQLSELDEISRLTSDEVGRVGDLLKNIPAYVIAASETVERTRNLLAFDRPSMWLARQQMLAARFLTASQQTVVSSHLIMIDRPDVVIGAVEEMVRAARETRPPAPLGSSESLPSTEALEPAGPVLPGAGSATSWSGGEPFK